MNLVIRNGKSIDIDTNEGAKEYLKIKGINMKEQVELATIELSNRLKRHNINGFFKWLELKNKLDEYEAALDISVDYAGSQSYRLKANNFIDELKNKYYVETNIKLD